jgi:hypothetical protein
MIESLRNTQIENIRNIRNLEISPFIGSELSAQPDILGVGTCCDEMHDEPLVLCLRRHRFLLQALP